MGIFSGKKGKEEKKLTDEDIVKALENCKNLKGCCFCTMWEEARKGNHCRDLSIDLIRRLQRENADLKEERENMQSEIIATEEARLQAVKDTALKIAERLKSSLDISVVGYSTSEIMSEIEDKIDEICKELTEEKHENTKP
jgi:hypothetical protein